MVLRIRLQRFGQKKAPFYHIVCTNARTARQSRPIEMLGTYDPIPRDGVKDVALNMDRTKYWLGVGAQPSDTAARVLEKANLFQQRPKAPARDVTKFNDARADLSVLAGTPLAQALTRTATATARRIGPRRG